ncbi:MAG: hypothetical protein U0517_01400 [Candidatus Andersenbacteria bacterium]
MKSLLNLYTGDDWYRTQPLETNGLDRSYAAWGRVMRRRKVQLVRASIHWYHKGRFTKYWIYDLAGKRWEKVRKPITPNGIYDKGRTHDPETGEQLVSLLAKKREVAAHLRMINLPQFSELVDNKLNQAIIFSKAMPMTRLWLPGGVIHNPRKKHVVLKALGGSGGTYVTITQKKRVKVEHLSVQQEFIQASNKGELKDYRVCFIGDEPIYVYNRVARPGSLYTNVHMGAAMEWMRLKDIPDLLKLCDQLMEPLRVFPKRVMSFDFLYDVKKHRPYLVETNTMPGTNNFSDELLERFFSKVTTCVLSD